MRFLLSLVLVGLAWVPAMAADCTQPAAPRVDWQRCYMDGRDLARHDLSGARLRETSFQRANLAGTLMAKVDAYRARFISADMRAARLDDGLFSDADFTKANLSGVSLARADIRRARFFHAILRGADLTGAKTQGAELINADLSGARWTDGQTICAEGSLGQCN